MSSARMSPSHFAYVADGDGALRFEGATKEEAQRKAQRFASRGAVLTAADREHNLMIRELGLRVVRFIEAGHC